MAQSFNSPAAAPAPATDASFDVYTGALSVKFPEAAAPTTESIADLALTGSLENYMNLGVKGGFAPTKTPGYPKSWVQQTVDGSSGGWPGSDSYLTQGGTSLPGIMGLNIKDDAGQLYEVVYVDETGKSRDIYKSSTLEPDHNTSLTPGGVMIPGLNIKDDAGQLYEVVYVDETGKSRDIYKSSTLEPDHNTSLTPGGVMIPGKKTTAPAPSTETTEDAPLWLKVASCCSSLVYCAGIVFLSSMMVPRK